MVTKTRFAPSPTGDLHVGGVRTALYAWLYAKHAKGVFVLRIEDTDSERSTAASVQTIIDGLQWLGITYDEGPYYQTRRYDRYKSIAEQLLAEGKAYRCTCSKERLEALRVHQLSHKEKPRYDGHCRERGLEPTDEPFVIRFKNPKTGAVVFTDEVYGEISVQNEELDDLVLIRSDGHPTYNFAVVIDDSDMGITHVIRGDDHINNTPRQINLFHALNQPVPHFAHLPMILGADGKRLSKRHGAVSVLAFKEEGILPQALLNYLVRLGWSSKDKEIFSLNEMIESFNLRHVSRGVSTFDYAKLKWLNQHYMKTLPPETIAPELALQFQAMGISIQKGPSLEYIIPLQATRCQTLKEMAEMSVYFYKEEPVYQQAAIDKYLLPPAKEPLITLRDKLLQLTEWTKDAIHKALVDTCALCDIGMGKIGQPLRVVLTGGDSSPSIDATAFLLGRELTIARISHALSCFF